MPCFKRWVRDGDQEVTIQATATDDVEVLILGRETINRATQSVTDRRCYDKAELAAGVSWTLARNRIYKMPLVGHPLPAEAEVKITIDGTVVHDGTCDSGQWPIVGEFRITTRA